MFKKDLEELKNKQTEMKNTITEMKNTLEGINSRITEAKEGKGRCKAEWWKSLPQNTIKKKEQKEMRTASETTGTTLNTPTFEL